MDAAMEEPLVDGIHFKSTGEYLMSRRLYILLVVGVLMCVVGWTGYGHGQRSAATRQTWEYRVLSRATQDDLDRYGSDGWELVAVGDTDPNGISTGRVAYLKRPR